MRATTPYTLRAKAARISAERGAVDKPQEPAKPIWEPQHRRDCAGGDACKCPQVMAYNSDADVIGYGGEAGGGKTDLSLGFAGTKHTRSLLLRRTFPQLEGMIARSREIFSQGESHLKDRYNESLHRWEVDDGGTHRTIRFGAVQHEKDKLNFQGRPNDFISFDETTQYTESIVRFIGAWLRTTVRGQKCRMLMPFNPPLPGEDGGMVGEWVVNFFAPWLDETHPNPAEDGELRWYAMLDGVDTEVKNGEPFEYTDKAEKTRTVRPKSRTFFHASLSDNPVLEETGYGDTLDALPEPLRSILKGSFKAGKTGDPWQVIPTAWVKAAQARWKPEPPCAMAAVGADIARGGADKLVISRQHGQWFDQLLKYPGTAIPDGDTAAALIVQAIKGTPAVGLDILNVGYSAFDSLRKSVGRAIGVNFGAGSDLTDKSGMYTFKNLRAECYWKLREALDPETGSDIALPPDSELLADLCAPRWFPNGGKIQIEEKEQIKNRLGRSPDCADALVIAYYANRNNAPLFLSGDDAEDE